MNVYVFGEGCIHINTRLSQIKQHFQEGDVSITAGGTAGNVALQLGRLGTQVAFAGKVGEDEMGDFFCRRLEKEGVCISGIVRKGTTPLVWIGLDALNKPRLVVKQGERDSVMDTFRFETFESEDIIYVPGFPTYMTLLERLSALNLLLFCDFGFIPDSHDWEGYRERLLYVLERADYVMANGFSFPRERFEELRLQLKGKRCKNLIVTFGGNDLISITSSYLKVYPVRYVEEDNPIGAGDVFMAGWIYAKIRNWSMDDAIVFAQQAAAWKVQRFDEMIGMEHLVSISQGGC